MSLTKLSISGLVGLTLFTFTTGSVFASFNGGKIPRASVLKTENVKEVVIKSEITPEICGFDVPESSEYKAEIVSVRHFLKVDRDYDFKVKVFLKNTGNMPWFSNKSTCLGPKMSLGTDRERDHKSIFYDPELEGWESSNRIGMDQLRVSPGEIASFTFVGDSGSENDVYKEYYTPVLKDIKWLDEDAISIAIIVGESDESGVELRKKLAYANFSGALNHMDFDGEKSIIVDLSEQKMELRLGNYVVKEFSVSSGKAGTPTPQGEYSIKLKQDVRIGGKSPHYIMPKFMWFKEGGFGFHALPSLGSASLRAKIKALQAAGEEVPTSLYQDDPFWQEANDHIGKKVSHGCVRLLPEDADFTYEFADVGTKVKIES